MRRPPAIWCAPGAEPTIRDARERLVARYGRIDPDQARVVVALGGNSTVLRLLHHLGAGDQAVFGMSTGAPDFLTNEYDESDLLARLDAAEAVRVRPLQVVCTGTTGAVRRAIAYNEVAVFRASARMSALSVHVDGRRRLARLLGDGLLVATPVGSTAYNLSARGPVLPLDSRALVLTPLSPARPHWQGAVVADGARIAIEVCEAPERPVAVTTDFSELTDVVDIRVQMHPTASRRLLFDRGDGLHERQIREQFAHRP
ncbi:MAG: NAD kinase [Brevundimonas sp.]